MTPPAESSPGVSAVAQPGLIQDWAVTVRRTMWRYAGIVRTMEGLERARRDIVSLDEALQRAIAASRLTPDLVELRNLVCLAELIIRSALSRHESRGLHYILDYPQPVEPTFDTVLTPA